MYHDKNYHMVFIYKLCELQVSFDILEMGVF